MLGVRDEEWAGLYGDLGIGVSCQDAGHPWPQGRPQAGWALRDQVWGAALSMGEI